MRMAESIFALSPVIRKTVSALLLPDSARERIRILLAAVSAVSEQEKKEESSSSKNKHNSCPISPGLSNEIITSIFVRGYVRITADGACADPDGLL